MKFNKNAVGREIPEYLEGIGELVPFKGVDAIKPTKKEFEFVETNLNKLRKEEE